MVNLGKSDAFGAYKEHEESPFKVQGITEKWIDKPGTERMFNVEDRETGEMFVAVTPPLKRRVLHDPVPYTKVMRVDITKLSCNAKVLLLYIAVSIKMNKKEIRLHWKTVSEWCGYSKSSYYTAVKELLDADILAIKLKKDNSYYVNPNYVFNGNRTKI